MANDNLTPKIILSNADEQCLSFYWDGMPGIYLGYRFFESMPLSQDMPHFGYPRQPRAKWGEFPALDLDAPLLPWESAWGTGWTAFYDERALDACQPLSFRSFADGSAWCAWQENDGRQKYTFYFQPDPNGVRIWFRLATTETLPASYCVQQCLRFTGRLNDPWRQNVAHVPFLSEFDMQAMGNPNGTLTYARRDGQWLNFPVPQVRYQTFSQPPGAEAVDHGLVVRETPARLLAPASYFQQVAPDAEWEQIAAGMYWERTALISNRHPADCLHAWLDFGPLEAGESRTLHGKVYFLVGSKDDLLARWQSDFTSSGAAHF